MHIKIKLPLMLFFLGLFFGFILFKYLFQDNHTNTSQVKTKEDENLNTDTDSQQYNNNINDKYLGSIENLKISKIYDGDTFFIDIEGIPEVLGKNLGVRIYGIDTPEMKTKDECEKNAGKKSKIELQKLFENAKDIKLLNCKRDKYFRLLCEVSVDGIDVAKHMIDKKMAYEYYGDSKALHKPNYCNQ